MVEGGGLVQFGAQSALPHGGPLGTKLAPNMIVLIDAGGEFQGYTSDITRTRWFGDAPPARFREVYNLVHAAQDAAMERVKPGVPAQEIDRAARIRGFYDITSDGGRDALLADAGLLANDNR